MNSIKIGKLRLFAGTTDHWGIGFDYNHYDRAFTIDFIHWYIGVEKWYDYSALEEWWKEELEFRKGLNND